MLQIYMGMDIGEIIACLAFVEKLIALISKLCKYPFARIKAYINKKKLRNSLLYQLKQLDTDEKALLREFYYPFSKNTISAPQNNIVLAGLLRKKIIVSDDNKLNRYGTVPCYIIKEFKELIDKNKHLISLPENPSEKEKISLDQSRPNLDPVESIVDIMKKHYNF